MPPRSCQSMLSWGMGEEAKKVEQAKYCVVELKKHSTTDHAALVPCCAYWSQERA